MNLPVGNYSLYNQFENCPHKAWHIYVLKDIPRVETPEMKWGNEVHSAMEHRIGDNVPLPDTMQAANVVVETIDNLKSRFPIRVEAQLAMDANGRSTDYWGKGAAAPWFRGKLDFVLVKKPDAWMLDWKTGKPREEPFELECGALLLKAQMPELENIQGEYFWMQTGQNGMRYTLNNHAQTFGKLQSLRTEMEGYAGSDAPWPKRKNPLCGYCPVKSCENCYDAKAGERKK